MEISSSIIYNKFFFFSINIRILFFATTKWFDFIRRDTVCNGFRNPTICGCETCITVVFFLLMESVICVPIWISIDFQYKLKYFPLSYILPNWVEALIFIFKSFNITWVISRKKKLHFLRLNWFWFNLKIYFNLFSK